MSPARRALVPAVALAALALAACAREGEGAWPPPRGPDTIPATPQAPAAPPPPVGRPQPPPGYGPPRPGWSQQPAPQPTASRPTNAPAVGLACRSDQDLVCPLGRCLGGRCGGCANAADCKPGATCGWTPVGMACVPGGLAGGAPVPGGAPAPGGAGPWESARQACVARTNELRARTGVGPVARRVDAERCLDSQASSDAAAGQAHGAFGRCGESSQNECPGWGGTPDSVVSPCLQSMFDEGPGEPYQDHGHYINMTTAKYTGVACGFATAPDGRVWLVQDFF